MLGLGGVVDQDQHGSLGVGALANFNTVGHAREDWSDAALPDEVSGEFLDERIVKPGADVGDRALCRRNE